jgi:predicted amidohydrolase
LGEKPFTLFLEALEMTPPRHHLKIASCQYPIGEPTTLDAWQDKIRTWVREGASQGADLLVFPEYAAIEQAAALGSAISGDLAATLAAVAELVETRVDLHRELARHYGVHILVGSGPARRADGRFVNAAQLVTPGGAVGVQDKRIMTPFERDWGVVPGDAVRVFETDIGCMGIAICYDCEFPLLVRAMAEAGAQVVLIPSCTERVSGFYRIRAGAAARALENTIATVTSPTVGDALWSPAVDRNSGSACVFVPPDALLSDTGVVAEGALDQPLWVQASVDLGRLRKLKTSGEMRNFADWSAQPGAQSLTHMVDVVQLC